MFRLEIRPIACSGAVASLLAACAITAGGELKPTAEWTSESNVIEVIARADAFEASETVPSGWATLRLHNQGSGEVHEISLARLPDDRTFDEYRAEVIPVWEEVLRRLQSEEIGRGDVSAFTRAHLPDWSAGVRWVHSRGLVSSGRSAENAVFLEPGIYSLESWLKTEEGELYLSRNLLRELVVAGDAGTIAPPSEADVHLLLTDSELTIKDTLVLGRQRVAVRLAEGALGRSVNLHLIRVRADTDLAEVARWMDWYDPRGLQAPEPAEFFGGFSTYGRTAKDDTVHFTVEIDAPGRYAWVVGAPFPRSLWYEFTVN